MTVIERLFGRAAPGQQTPAAGIGTPGYLAALVAGLGGVLFVPSERLPLVAVVCLGLAALLFPASFRRLLQLRWIVVLGALPIINALLLSGRDGLVLGIPYSSTGLQIGLVMALRAVIVLVMVDGFAGKVDISEVAGLFERLGLRGLGFSVGIAFNLLPILRQSSTNAWHSLWLRGGLRRRRRRGLQLFLVTVVGNAIRRAEEIALAAEARAFSPEKARPMPLKRGRFDPLVILGIFLAVLSMVVL
jgi:energy-coupling factor transporter transmembrane protein EcfT